MNQMWTKSCLSPNSFCNLNTESVATPVSILFHYAIHSFNNLEYETIVLILGGVVTISIHTGGALCYIRFSLLLYLLVFSAKPLILFLQQWNLSVELFNPSS